MVFFPKEGRFVRPGSSTYREWQTLAYENTPSLETRLRLKKLAEIQSEPELPCTQTPKYKWPSRILLRPKEGTDQVHMARLQPDPCVRHVRFAQDATTQTDEAVEEEIVKPVDAGVDISDPNDVPEGAVAQEDVRTEYSPGDEISLDVAVGSDNDPDLESGNPWASDDDSLDLLDEYWEIPIQGMPGTPVEKLAQEYERVMRVTAEDLELEPAVYMHEGSELLSQLRGQLVMLPELRDLIPECKIEEADVGVPGKTDSEMDEKLRRILRRHRCIFLGDGNAAPAPARGVVCDLDVGDAKPVAQRPRSVAPHLLIKVYELLKKLLETGLIEYSESPWASPIVIVLKKNGIDIRMCIDYRIVNTFIKLSHYPLPLIDDLLIGFEAAMWFMSLDMTSGF